MSGEDSALGRIARGAAVAVAAGYMLYSCALDAGLQLQRTTLYDTCEEADAAAAASQRVSVTAELDGELDKMNNELAYQSAVIWENAPCFPTDLVIETKMHLLELEDER